jgi:hypothetical protein
MKAGICPDPDDHKPEDSLLSIEFPALNLIVQARLIGDLFFNYNVFNKALGRIIYDYSRTSYIG